MTDARYKIVFDGELMPGAAPDAVKDNLARLFKSDRARIDGLFGRRGVALKRDLGSDEADKYLEALQQAGAKVRKEADLAAALTLVAAEDEPSVEPSTTMTCPKCGHLQPKSAQCDACGIVIEKYLARQAQLAEAPTAPVVQAASPYAPPQAQVGDVLPDHGELKVFSVEGRIGRLRYLAWYVTLALLTMPIAFVLAFSAALSPTFAMVLGVVGLVAFVAVSICIGAQRLHDIGWTGWLQLLLLVPIVGAVFGLLMMIIPGNADANRYGPPPPPNSRSVVVLACACILMPMLVGILAAIAIPAYQTYVTRAHQTVTPAAPVSPAQP
ncbi:DUF805 domain-containing protein [Pseudomonas mangiferae]|uniref:DUF805 domain-containing protein n=1 Tax=Pseudomonas mangiferae TaxID=2593654 RepID=A0A553GZW0_9PSED|nr:DUF805 domain-containing protein [Pseudomonas mangiferae]TRX75045.1 DUF805 domain-containing protein [Pseudomonas mangiferae]